MANVAKKEKKEKKDKKEKKEKKSTEKQSKKRPNESNGTSDPPSKKQCTIPDSAKWREEHAVTVCDIGAKYHPVGFADSGLPADVLKCTASFSTPTPIQAQSWPIILAGRDLIGIAKTGSGKTYAFILPCLAQIKLSGAKNKPTHPAALVLAPTRELCTQIAVVGEEAAGHCGLRVVRAYGGMPKDAQRSEIAAGCNVIIATPGRLKDLCQEGERTLSLKKVTYAVLDEADRMLDMGFEDDVREILGQTASRQTVMFSATWPVVIQGLAKEFLKDPARITIGSEELAANHAITQLVEVIDDEKWKYGRLKECLTKYHTYEQKNRVIIFGLYKKEVARLEQMLWNDGWQCVAIQGDMSQQARNQAYEQFKSGKINLLIATDVAARGLDIKGVEYVINASFPLTVEDYVHRIGRTGRAGMSGFAHTFFYPQRDKQLAPGLIRVLEEAKQEVPKALEKFRHVAPKKAPASRKNPYEAKDGSFKVTGAPPVQKEVFSDSD